MTTIRSIAALVSCENMKIYRQRKYIALLASTVFITAAAALLSVIPGNLLNFTMSNYPYTILSLLGSILAPLAVFILVSDILSGEMAGSEIRVLLTRPVSRISVLFAKIVAITGYVGALFVTGFLVSFLTSIVFAGFVNNILTTLAAYLVGFLPMIALISMSAMIASMLKSGTSCFGVSLFAYLGSMAAGLVFSGLSPALFTSYLSIGSMVIGSVVPITNLLMGITVITGYSLLFLSVSGLGFAGREF